MTVQQKSQIGNSKISGELLSHKNQLDGTRPRKRGGDAPGHELDGQADGLVASSVSFEKDLQVGECWWCLSVRQDSPKGRTGHTKCGMYRLGPARFRASVSRRGFAISPRTVGGKEVAPHFVGEIMK
jgi:hypothetical protein